MILECSCLTAAALWVIDLAPALSSTIPFSLCLSCCIPTVTYWDCQQRGACFGLAWDLLVTIPFSRLHFCICRCGPLFAQICSEARVPFLPWTLNGLVLSLVFGCLNIEFGNIFLLRTRSLRDLPWVPPILVGRMTLQTCSSKFWKTSSPGPF